MAAMAQRKFGLQINFGHGLLQPRQKEERIVAKATRAARRRKNLALDCTFGAGKCFSVLRRRQNDWVFPI